MLIRRISVFLVLLFFGSGFTSNPAHAGDLIFCVNKSSRVVTFPATGKCPASAITLNLVSNDLRLPKSHTTTAAIVPNSKTLKVFVPNVLAMDRNRAIMALENSGLKVVIKLVKSDKNARVIQVSPKVGSQVAGGSVVTIVLG